MPDNNRIYLPVCSRVISVKMSLFDSDSVCFSKIFGPGYPKSRNLGPQFHQIFSPCMEYKNGGQHPLKIQPTLLSCLNLAEAKHKLETFISIKTAVSLV